MTSNLAEASFRVPDERGFQPQGRPIVHYVEGSEPRRALDTAQVAGVPAPSSASDSTDVWGDSNGAGAGGGVLHSSSNYLLHTAVDNEALAARLRQEGHTVLCSDDCGLFVCNFCAYTSYFLGSRRDSGCLRGAGPGGEAPRRPMYRSLFVHIPLHSTVDFDQQVKFAEHCIQALADQLSAGKGTGTGTGPTPGGCPSTGPPS